MSVVRDGPRGLEEGTGKRCKRALVDSGLSRAQGREVRSRLRLRAQTTPPQPFTPAAQHVLRSAGFKGSDQEDVR